MSENTSVAYREMTREETIIVNISLRKLISELLAECEHFLNYKEEQGYDEKNSECFRYLKTLITKVNGEENE